ncbi:formate dehydrogenase subunit alpha [Undibacterium oligocarboniphilum]|uniref:Formate dehydrogenase subunit alpha n=1 Tax=Undibacterium oligocarboniphilum TaxID=666702 RepID=A0A850QBZ5_9BURK|nr:formate dehydrogenase subunit alpha [Undibacterium oligocarboniphilum]MBC3871060.1 formate dehydrogenase subunit alpha [Undibacterium oligocarboniphilum]NVO76317.1 formate dehydrogenase subunit alpha [Undibacterium oligocarboniphilum]
MNCHHEIDYGTPASTSSETVELSIDGFSVSVPKGTSLMRAAIDAGIHVPKLCATDSLEPFGSCRLCLVEIEGRRGYPASCTTPAEAGMVVRTQTAKLQDLRKGVMELYISDHPLDCLTCSANGDCELQDMAGVTGLRNVRYGVAGQDVAGVEGAHHCDAKQDVSNPYFTYDASKCIVCNRCVRACEETQGTFALTISGRGFESRVSPGQDQAFMDSECVSCGACVQACPTATLQEKTVIELGQPEHSILTTCAYCGVGCGFKAEMKGSTVVRMVPWKDGKANEGHSCIKGRFAWGYATHKDRMTKPMIRKAITDPWQEVSWEEALNYAASEFKRIQHKYGKDSVGGITSSRCTNEETYLVQKLVRAALGNNNVDTCARVCHSPTGYGLGQTFGTSAGTQTFKSVEHADVILVMGANPSDAHPVFASRMKKRLRQGAKLIVIDPRKIDLVSAPHVKAQHHLALKPGTNVAMITAMAHVVVTEKLYAADYVQERCDNKSFAEWSEFVSRPENSPEAFEAVTGVPAAEVRAAARTFASGPNSAIYYGLGVTEHAQGSTTVIGIANLAMACGMVGREGVGVNPLRGQNNVQGSCDMGSFPHELPGYRHISDSITRNQFDAAWGVHLDPEPGLRIPNMFDAALDGSFKALYCHGEDIAQSDPNTQHVSAALSAMECIVVQDIFLNETAKFAHVFLPGSSFLEKDGTFTNAERRISRVNQVMPPLAGYADWQTTLLFAKALGYEMHYDHPSQIMDEIAALTPSFHGVSYEKIEQFGSVQWPCNENTALAGTDIMHVDHFVRGKGRFLPTQYVASEEKITQRFPLLLTTGRILSQYNVGAQTRRTENNQWHDEDVLEIHPHDAQERGIETGMQVGIESRVGRTVMTAVVSERMQPGVVYTTFHFPESGANVITTENSDWATNCPEYKVTAVQVITVTHASEWQERYQQFNRRQLDLLTKRRTEKGRALASDEAVAVMRN